MLRSCYSLAGVRDTNEDVAACARFSAQSTALTVPAAVRLVWAGTKRRGLRRAVQTLFARLHGAL